MSQPLLIPQRVALAKKYVALDIHPEKNEKINNYRGAESKKREVDKIKPDFGAGNIELLAKIAANAKCI